MEKKLSDILKDAIPKAPEAGALPNDPDGTQAFMNSIMGDNVGGNAGNNSGSNFGGNFDGHFDNNVSNNVDGKNGLTPVQRRLGETAVELITDPATIKDAMFHHSIFCQTYLPYKDPGDGVTLWEQKQGNASLAIQTVKLKDPITEEWAQIGLPYGTRARLILAYINTQAVKSQSQVIDVEEHLSGFVTKLGLTRNGRTINEIKEQIRRITASIITLGFRNGEKYIPINFGIVKAFDLWFPKDDKQRIAWSSKICLTDDYFNSLMQHAIPLDERAIGALAHSAMSLDVYTWLVQRLHRIPHGQKQFVSWQQLKDQFGQGYNRMDNFKTAFRTTLKTVLLQYNQARHSITEEHNKGFFLQNAPTPIDKKIFNIPNLGGGSLIE